MSYDIETRGQSYKTFYVRNLPIFVISRVFVPGMIFQPSLLFVSKIRAVLSAPPSQKAYTKSSNLLDSPTNIRLDWKSLPGIL